MSKAHNNTCEVPACERPAGDRRRGHPIHPELCGRHGAEIWNFGLWLRSLHHGDPDASFDSARAAWERSTR